MATTDEDLSLKHYKLTSLTKNQQRRRLRSDTMAWLASGHHIMQLPPEPVVATGSHVSFFNLLMENGFPYEL